MKLNKKLLAATVISLTAISGAYAVDQDIDADVTFRTALSFANAVAMDFGTIDVGGSAAAVTFDMDVTDGSITNSDTTNYTAPASGTLGSVELEGDTGATVDISCETSGVLANSGGTSTINLDNTDFDFNGANITACAGLGTSPLSSTLTAGTDTIQVGGRLNLTAAPNIEAYSTTNTNGNPVTLRAVYQ